MSKLDNNGVMVVRLVADLVSVSNYFGRLIAVKSVWCFLVEEKRRGSLSESIAW